MTTAAPLLLAEQGDFPDVEAVVMDMLAVVQVDDEAIGARAGTRTPTVHPDEPMPDLYFHVFRQVAAGGLNRQGWSDLATVYVAAWAPTRDKARQMIRGARAVFAEYADGGAHKGVLLDRVWETSAPGPLPVVDEDDRRVELGVAIRTRAHNGPAVYA